MKRTAALAAVIVSLVAGSAAPPRAAASQTVAAAPVSIPFELATHHIIVKARVNDSRPLSFVLDTGAATAIVRTEVAKELGLSLQGKVTTGGAGPGTQIGSFVKEAKWSLVGLDEFTQPVALALPFDDLPSTMGREIDGIIGGEFIKQFVLEVDYDAHTLRLHDRATFSYTGPGESLPIDFTPNGYPILKATVTPLGGGPLERPFLLDIGSGLALALHSPFVSEQHLLGPQSKTIRAIGTGGAGGRALGRLGRVAALRIGSFTIDSPITMFSEDTGGALANRALAGNIGAQVARRFRVWLDYGRRRLILEPSRAFGDPFDRAFSGFSMRALGPDFRTFRVHEVLEHSPAAEAGIVEGDLVVSIDGTPADTLTLTAIQELFEKPVSRELTIRRANQTITVTLTPARLI